MRASRVAVSDGIAETTEWYDVDVSPGTHWIQITEQDGTRIWIPTHRVQFIEEHTQTTQP